MTATELASSQASPALPADAPLPSAAAPEALATLCQRVLAYAARAKVQRFRYCRRPHRPSSAHTSLAQAIQALDRQLAAAEQRPVCQTLAVELLRELAALAQQPPCQSSRQQKAAALSIDTALLELR